MVHKQITYVIVHHLQQHVQSVLNHTVELMAPNNAAPMQTELCSLCTPTAGWLHGCLASQFIRQQRVAGALPSCDGSKVHDECIKAAAPQGRLAQHELGKGLAVLWAKQPGAHACASCRDSSGHVECYGMLCVVKGDRGSPCVDDSSLTNQLLSSTRLMGTIRNSQVEKYQPAHKHQVPLMMSTVPASTSHDYLQKQSNHT